MASLKVAIVGAGSVGTTLGKALARRNAALVTYGEPHIVRSVDMASRWS